MEKVTHEFAEPADILEQLGRAVRTLHGARDPDLEQEACVRALQAFRRGEVRHPRALLWKIVRDTLVDHWRSAPRSRWDGLDSAPEEAVAVRPEFEAELDRGRRAAALSEAILDLGGEVRGPVYLFYIEGYPIETIARIYGKSPSAVKMALHRGRLRLARMFRHDATKKSRFRRTFRGGPGEAAEPPASGKRTSK